MFGGEDDTEIPPEEKPARIRELVDALPPEAESEATELINQEDDADEVIEGLEQILADHSPDSVDEAVSKAKTLVQLERMLSTEGTITSWVATRIDGLTGNETAQLREAIAEVPPPVESQADTLVSQSSSADTLTSELNNLTETYYDDQANELVQDAESISDLSSPEIQTQEQATETTEEPSLFDTLREHTGRGLDEAQTTIQNAEPHEAAMWGLLAGAAVMNPAFGAPAVAAETSTAALVGATAIGGVGVGAYASSHDDSMLAEVNPAELYFSSMQVAEHAKDIDEIDGRTLGAVLGASSHLAEILTPDAYAQWITQADPEAVLEGAALGAKHAQVDTNQFSSRGGTALGAGLGLLYSYVEDENAEEQLHSVLDDDLWESYQETLEE